MANEDPTKLIDYFGTGYDAGAFSFLSNFHEHDGWTVEHHYQAAKTDNSANAAQILAAPTPGQAKRLGRQTALRPTWEDEKILVMLTLLRVKFRIPQLTQKLLGTGNAELVEGNTWGDRYWGVFNGEGENHLGRLLMQVRSELQQTQP